MIEKIGTEYYEKLSEPNKTLLSLVSKKKLESDKHGISVLEIGVGIGATSIEIIDILDERDIIYFMDYEDKLRELRDDIDSTKTNTPEICYYGNSRKILDSYVWSLSKMVESGQKVDVLFLDGAHNFVFDGLVLAMAKYLLNSGGYLVVDDPELMMRDIIKHNPSLEASVLEQYTDEQINSKQIERALNCFIYSDVEFGEILSDIHEMKIFVKR